MRDYERNHHWGNDGLSLLRGVYRAAPRMVEGLFMLNWRQFQKMISQA